ncbi:MAG: hypothetical protein HY565_02640 [Candidatus Kerfeldbacteria bacterium]|nr:hypothetical protein [Candidatus Kerfeldbacteria bacterium]
MRSINRIVDIVFVTIATFYPLVGVVWLGWDIGNTIFLYIVEAAIVLVYHGILYWQTKRLFTDPDIQRGYVTVATLRVCAEATVVLVALMTFIDFVMGRHVAAAFHVDAIGSYMVTALIPIGSLFMHYGQRLRETPRPVIVLPVGWWLLHYPLPLFVCGFVLVNTRAVYLPVLLLLVVLLKAIVEYRLIRPLSELSQAPRDLTILTGHPYALMNILRRSVVYLLVGVGMMSINPYFSDPSFTLLENVFIFIGFSLLWLPCLRLPKIRLELKAGIIYWEQLGWLRIRRTIPVADIKGVKGFLDKRVKPPRVSAHIFTIKRQRRWRLGPFYFLRNDWLAWLKQLNTKHPELKIPYL